MVFKIDGFDIVPYIESNGIDWTPNGIDGPDAGRVMSARMYRGLIGHKGRCDLTLLWMTKDTLYDLFQVIMREYVTVQTDTIPWIKGTATIEAYINNAKCKLSEEYSDGTKEYRDISFPIVER